MPSPPPPPPPPLVELPAAERSPSKLHFQPPAMSARLDKAIAHERRRAGENALSDFADYVEKQQRLRNSSATSSATTAKDPAIDENDELSILETLGLSDEAHSVAKLKGLLIESSVENRSKLREHIQARIAEGRGETLFDVGHEDNGESMGLTTDEYNVAFNTIKSIAEELDSAVTVLLTKNTGVDSDVECSTKDASAKVIIRRQPQSIDELLEIRIAVVGNGECGATLACAPP